MISCQFSLYPLGTQDLSPAIDAAIAELKGCGLEPHPGPMSTYLTGDSRLVFEGLRRAFDAVAGEGQVVMTVTLSNACPLPEV